MLAVSQADESVSVIAVYDPAAKAPRYFESWAMPFGATAAVTRFNRVSAALEYVLSKERGVHTSSYFDDFAPVSPGSLAAFADEAAREFSFPADRLAGQRGQGTRLCA